MARRSAALLLVVTLVAALGACARMPTSGPVVAGPALEVDADPGLRFQPLSPARGASPLDIVRGFLLAAAGVEDDHAFARAYLSPQRAESWRPAAGTTVYANNTATMSLAQAGEPVPEGEDPALEGGDVTVTLTATVTAGVDADGRFAAQPPGTHGEFAYSLDRVSGEWRITELPEGLLVDEAGFDLGFSSYQLYFVDPTVSFLVPETRWFPDRRSLATTLATELMRGPSAWLAGAVTTGFPEGTALTPPAAVTVVEGEAQVDLTRAVLSASSANRALLQAQLQATLRPVRTISSVRLTVEGAELVLPGTVPALVRDPGVDAAPVAVAAGTLVELQEGVLVPVPELPPLEDLGVSHPGKAPATFAVLAAERSQLLHVVPGTDAEPELLLTGADLTAPSIDPRSWIWATSAVSDGVVTAARPGTGVAEVDAAWLEGRRVSSLRVSRDGTRAVVASTGSDGSAFVDLAGVDRDGDGRPVALVRATERSIAPSLTQVREAVWTGESSVAVLGRRADDGAADVYVSEVLGEVVPVGAPVPDGVEVVDLAAGAGERSLVVATEHGDMWQRAGAQWVEVPAEVAVRNPAFAG